MSISLGQRLRELAVFAGLREDPVIDAFFNLIGSSERQESMESVRGRFCYFAGKLYAAGYTDWTDYLRHKVLCMPTCCSDFASQDHEIPSYMLDAAMNELASLAQAGSLNSEFFFDDPTMPAFSAHECDLQGEYLNRLMHVSEYGFGIFAEYRMFRVEQLDGEIRLKPIAHPDPVTFNDLYGYQSQHEEVIDNSMVLLNNQTASNILLYGDAGTGKSATVKATVNLLYPQGLRLIEVRKNQLELLPELLEELSVNPLKFIIFIDDLSFQENDDEFSALKAVLEGTVSARSQNVVIYATSNRRHIVRETFSDRGGDDVHRNDTMQETISLSDRFGMRILFEKPSIQEYRNIVLQLAKAYKIDMDEDRLMLKAEQFALRKSGRSARAARQFIEQLAVRQEK
ncbi:ATP-binding protein [Ileibacterium valens]|uniref:ATP-binding protein n=1 Tax=Ileibacterium valens TaxID=1862668 RepID=UPI00272D38A7|nr:DUF815 domain-containing protein [Ileibacterium valens]